MATTTYHCGWCGWNGSRIQEQAAGNGQHCCWQCGLPVRPGPHSSDPGAGNRPGSVSERANGEMREIWRLRNSGGILEHTWR